MALRDLFDADKRTKEELRQLLEQADNGRMALLSALATAQAEKLAADESAVTALQEASRRQDALLHRQASLDDRAMLIAEKEDGLLKAQVNLEFATQLNLDRAAELDAGTARLQKDRAALDERAKQLDARGLQLQVQAHQLGNREHAVKEREAAAAATEKDLGNRQTRLQAGEAALRKERDEFNPRQLALTRREEAVRRWEHQKAAVEDALAEARSRITALERARKELEQRVSALLQEVELHTRRAEVAEEQLVQEVKSHRVTARQLREIRSALRAPLVLLVNDIELLHTMAGLHAETVIEEVGTQPVTLGSGPWKESVFDTALEHAGFEPQLLDECAADFEVFIVGREGVDIDVLAGALEARMDQGLPVRLYSQELWLLYLMSGVDPLSWDAEMLQRTVGSDHPVIWAFVNEVWQWPQWPEPSVVDGASGDTVWLERGASPLHTFGYRARRGTVTRDRRETLQAFLACKSLTPHFDPDQHDTAYRASWGRPNSSKRLHRMVSHIQWLLGFQGASLRKGAAREDWEEDLRWIQRSLSKTVNG